MTTHDDPTMRQDALATLAALRPRAGGEQAWTAQEQAALRQRIMATDLGTGTGAEAVKGVTGDGTPLVRPLRSRRQHAAVIALSVAVLAGGSGAAAASGLMPQAFIDSLSSWRTWPEGPPVDPATAQRIATAPGPDGTVFTLMAAAAADDPDFQCVVALYETPDSALQPGPAAFQDVSGNWCQDGPDDRPFGAIGSDVANAAWFTKDIGVRSDTWVWYASAGKAVTAELRTTDGASYPVLKHNGMFFGWVPAPALDQPHPVLIGYDANGKEVGRDTV